MKKKEENKKEPKKTAKKQLSFALRFIRNSFLILIALGFFAAGAFAVWFSTLSVPNIDSLEDRQVTSSTKIFDRNGVLLYDIHEDVQRTLASADEISIFAKNAAVAIEDDNFYNHKGIELKAIARAIWTNFKNGNLLGGQGGSTITQQVVKNTLLTQEKRLVRKFKEWIIALRLEQQMTKDEILALYLNENPYGGNLYGIQEASNEFFGKNAIDLTLNEAAYLAAIPNAPTRYSPYGNNRNALDARKDLVLKKMHELNFITEEEYNEALEQEATFLPQRDNSAKALHFVQYIREYLEETYGREAVLHDGLRVTTTLDWELQKQAEEIVKKNALENEEAWGASNQGAVVIEATTGQILSMIGSRNYFDQEIDGNYNVTLAKRQPGSSFKPFVYVTAFEKGYRPETVLFDTRTQFSVSSRCPASLLVSDENCYAPANYDNLYKGPLKLRDALGQSRNVPAVKLLYLVGIADALRTAKTLGIETLNQKPSFYGLTLVLGGGEVRLLDMVSAYSAFANNGMQHRPTGILSIEDKDGTILEEYQNQSYRVLDANAVAMLNSILSDNVARTPLFGPNSFMYFGESQDVAAKTGTTDDSRDGWLVGYNPRVVVGVWTGNNDNTPMRKGSSISGPTWRSIMQLAMNKYPSAQKKFTKPAEVEFPEQIKPIHRGIWAGGDVFEIDTISGKLATDLTPEETRKTMVITNPHSSLHWINKSDPDGPAPTNPTSDNQYSRWEFQVQKWLSENPVVFNNTTSVKPVEYDDVHTVENKPIIEITTPSPQSTVIGDQPMNITLKQIKTAYPISRVNYFINDTFVGSSSITPFSFTVIPNDVEAIRINSTIRAIAVDNAFNQGEATLNFVVQ